MVAVFCKAHFGFLTSTRSSYDEKSLRLIDTIMLYKARAALLVRFGLFLNNYYSEGYFIEKARL